MKAAAYVRYSSDNQREESIDAQIRAINEYAAREGHSVVMVYADEARSATTDKRPQFQKMIKDVDSKSFDCVIVHKLDRFSRDRYDSAFYKRILKKHGIRLISVLENLNDSPESIILESVLEGMAEYYSRNLAREVMKGLKETAYQCKHTGGIAPLGYDVAPDKSYIINEKEAGAIKLIFEMYAAGSGYGPIIAALNEKGYKTKVGLEFGKNSLHDILKNEKYAGVFIFNRTERKINGTRNGHKKKPDEEIIRVEGGIPAIVSRILWDTVSKKMRINKNTQSSYRAKVLYLLSGKLFCGECGFAFVGKTGNSGRNKALYSSYECGGRKKTHTCSAKAVGKSFIEELVIKTIYDGLFSPSALKVASKELYIYYKVWQEKLPGQLKDLSKQLKKVENEIKNIVGAISAGMFQSSMKDKLDELESSKALLTIALLEAQNQKLSPSLTQDQIRSFLVGYSDLKTSPIEKQKNAVDLFVEKVTIFNDHIDIDSLVFCPENKNATLEGGNSAASVSLCGRDTIGGAEGS